MNKPYLLSIWSNIRMWTHRWKIISFTARIHFSWIFNFISNGIIFFNFALSTDCHRQISTQILLISRDVHFIATDYIKFPCKWEAAVFPTLPTFLSFFFPAPKNGKKMITHLFITGLRFLFYYTTTFGSWDTQRVPREEEKFRWFKRVPTSLESKRGKKSTRRKMFRMPFSLVVLFFCFIPTSDNLFLIVALWKLFMYIIFIGTPSLSLSLFFLFY